MNLVDSSAWIEFFFGGNNASFFSKAIVDTQSLIVPVICLYEVFKKVNQVADEGRALEVIAQMKQGRVVPISEEIALKASLVSIREKLSMSDSLIYATGILEQAVIWTQDEVFQGLENVKFKAKS